MKTTIHFAFISGLVFTLTSCVAQENCESRRPVKTPGGALVESQCVDSKGAVLRSFVSVAGTQVLTDKALFEAEHRKDRTLWVFTGKADQETGCPSRLYLLDLSAQPPKVIAFGVKKACNEFHWASWGNERSVIAIKSNVKFIYEDGKMTVPSSGEGLWQLVQPPHAGNGLNPKDAIAFAEDVPSK